jgi:hypothetical protein
MTHIAIDRTNMAFKAKGEFYTLAYWTSIEIPHVSTVIAEFDTPRQFKTFTDLELRMLIRNTTGADHPNAIRDHMLATCAALADALAPTPHLNEFELRVQDEWIDRNDPKGAHRYQYAPGDSKPQRKAELWEPPALHYHRELDATAVQALQRAAQRAAPVAPPTPRSPSSAPAVRVAVPKGPPRGGLRAEVWQHMDSIWQASGTPLDIKVVLDLRKRCMDELEKQGCKRTSVSSELGNWWKERSTAKV